MTIVVAPSREFELTAISYTGPRVDHWIGRLRDLIGPDSAWHDWDKQRQSQHTRAIEVWSSLTKLLNTRNAEPAEFREHIVQRAYDCITFADVLDLLRILFDAKTGTKLWYILQSIARPMTDCRMIWHIAKQYPQFRDVRITPVTPIPKTGISLEYQIDVSDAWARLNPAALPEDIKTVAAFEKRFKKDCAASYGLHAEIQLHVYFEDNPKFIQTFPYFGCSKKACLLCETFLRALPNPIETRGRHGICYPAWGSPAMKSVGAETAFKGLKRTLVSRIKSLLSTSIREQKAYFQPPVPQSMPVSDFSALALQDLINGKERIESSKKAEMELREKRLIL